MKLISLKNSFLPLLAAFLLFTACSLPDMSEVSGRSVQRYGMVTGIKPEKIAWYKELHARAWPGVLRKIKECNIRNYSIYLKEIDGSYYLFSYFEYTGDNFGKDMEKMAADSTTQRWWRETDPTQIPLPDAVSAGQVWSGMEEVFHTE